MIAPGLTAALGVVQSLRETGGVVVSLISPGAHPGAVELAQTVGASFGVPQVEGNVADGECVGSVEVLEVVDSLEVLVTVGPWDTPGHGDLGVEATDQDCQLE